MYLLDTDVISALRRPDGRYVGAEPQPDVGEPFQEKMARLDAQWREQQAEAAKLDAAIAENVDQAGVRRTRFLSPYGIDEYRENYRQAHPTGVLGASCWMRNLA